MVREDILGGLRTALQRGESLRKAMLTFFNAGYSKQEIEEAARALQSEGEQPQQQVQQQMQPTIQPVKTQPSTQKITTVPKIPKKVSGYGEKPSEPVLQPVVVQPAISQQQVSTYGEPKKPKGKAIIFILIALLLILLGILAAIFFFKDEILKFFNLD